MIAADIAGLFQRPDPAQAGRRRNADALGQLDIGHAPIGLEIGQNTAVDIVEFDALHRK